MTEEEASEYNRKNINPNGGSLYYNDRSYRGYSKSGALSAYAELSAQYPGLLSSDIINPSAQLKQAQKELARAKKQAEKDALKARMTDYRNRMNAFNKSQTTSSKKAPILNGNRRTEK